MVRLLLVTMLAAALPGCTGHNVKVDHPVVGPPPPRIRNETAVAYNDPIDESAGRATVKQVSATDELGPIPMTAVAARVNGQPILVGTVLSQARSKLKQIEAHLTPQQYPQYRQAQLDAIGEFLPSHIEQTLMVQSVKSKLKDEQLKSVNEQLEKGFDKYLHEQVMTKMNVQSTTEVEAILQQQGLTLQVMHDMWVDRALATEYMRAKMEAPAPVTAPELRAAYHEHTADFTEPARIKWQQIQISFAKYNGQANAQAAAQEALAALGRGASFDAVAKQYSDGADAANGGHWDWTEVESLTEELRVPLSDLPELTPSEVIPTSRNFQIVQVEERVPVRTKPFEDVQDELKQQIQEKRQRDKFKRIIDELKATAVIETILDEETAADPAGPAESEAP